MIQPGSLAKKNLLVRWIEPSPFSWVRVKPVWPPGELGIGNHHIPYHHMPLIEQPTQEQSYWPLISCKPTLTNNCHKLPSWFTSLSTGLECWVVPLSSLCTRLFSASWKSSLQNGPRGGSPLEYNEVQCLKDNWWRFSVIRLLFYQLRLMQLESTWLQVQWIVRFIFGIWGNKLNASSLNFSQRDRLSATCGHTFQVFDTNKILDSSNEQKNGT